MEMVWSKREGSMDRCNHVDIGLSGISVCSAVFELIVGASTLPPNVQPSPCRFSPRFCRSAIEDEQATTIPHLAGGARSIAGPCDILIGIYRACSLSQGFLAPSVFSTRYLCLLWPRDAAIYSILAFCEGWNHTLVIVVRENTQGLVWLFPGHA